jgi:hyperosmotically inducible periplasmic protein
MAVRCSRGACCHPTSVADFESTTATLLQRFANPTQKTMQFFYVNLRRKSMNQSTKIIALALFAATTVFTTGCAVTRSQETVGQYVDDATITTQIKSRWIADPTVDAASFKVETLKGTVQISGFAKNAEEKRKAEAIARGVNGVIAVQNSIAVRS